MDEQMQRIRRQYAEILELQEETRRMVAAHEARHGPLPPNPATDQVLDELKANLDRIRRQDP